MMAASSMEDRILVPLKSVVFPNLKHACFFITRLPRESEDDIGSGDSQFRALTMGELVINSDDEGSVVSDGSFEMDEDMTHNITNSRTSFLRSILPPFRAEGSVFDFRGRDANTPRLERMSRVGLPGGDAADFRLEFAYPFPPGMSMSDPMPQILTVYSFPSNEENDRALVFAPGKERRAERREDVVPVHVFMAMLRMGRVPGGRLELVGFSQTALKRFAAGRNSEERLNRVFWLKEDGSFESVASLPLAENTEE